MDGNKKNMLIILLLFLIISLLMIGIGFRMFTAKKETVVKKEIPEIVEKKIKKKPLKNKDTIAPQIESTEGESDTLNLDPDPEKTNEIEEIEVETEQKLELPSVEKKDLTTIYIPSTKSLFRKPDISEYRTNTSSRITSTQRKELRIDEIKTDILMKNIPSEDLSMGKLYYAGENGRLESFVYIEPKGKIREYLLSFDPKGNYVDCIEIGLISPENERIKHAGLLTNKISIFETQYRKSTKGKEEIVTEYTINPQLQFKKGKTFTKVL
jgi:hypothetical protein